MSAVALRLLSVNVGMPQIIGSWNGEAVLSGFVKAPVAAPDIFVGATDLAGDGQADLSVHGGRDKAVYCYPAEHWPWWEREKAFACRPAAFGENLTVEGADETVLAIGDRFRWGEALLEISQPRAPCFKFALASGRTDAPSLMVLSGRCGWYFRVLEEGRAPSGGRLVREQASAGPTVREAFLAALHPHIPAEVLKRVFETAELAESWRAAVGKKLDSQQRGL